VLVLIALALKGRLEDLNILPNPGTGTGGEGGERRSTDVHHDSDSDSDVDYRLRDIVDN